VAAVVQYLFMTTTMAPNTPNVFSTALDIPPPDVQQVVCQVASCRLPTSSLHCSFRRRVTVNQPDERLSYVETRPRRLLKPQIDSDFQLRPSSATMLQKHGLICPLSGHKRSLAPSGSTSWTLC
jgi:hypothetical protein